jgi:hypothetical protein
MKKMKKKMMKKKRTQRNIAMSAAWKRRANQRGKIPIVTVSNHPENRSPPTHTHTHTPTPTHTTARF